VSRRRVSVCCFSKGRKGSRGGKRKKLRRKRKKRERERTFGSQRDRAISLLDYPEPADKLPLQRRQPAEEGRRRRKEEEEEETERIWKRMGLEWEVWEMLMQIVMCVLFVGAYCWLSTKLLCHQQPEGISQAHKYKEAIQKQRESLLEM
jgi:hypothetical protein